MSFELKSIDSQIDTLLKLPSVSVHDPDGKRIFLGTPAQLATAWRNKDFGNNPQIGDISDESGKAVIRFGITDSDQFFSRARISEIFNLLCARSETQHSVASQMMMITPDKIREALRIPDFKEAVFEAYRKVHSSNRLHLRDDMFLCSYGTCPDGSRFEQVSGEIGQYFDAHGISKGDELKSLIDLLEHRVDSSRDFYTAPFEGVKENKRFLGSALGTGDGAAYKDGLAVVVSGYKKTLSSDGIEFVFINDAVNAIIEPLKRAFPQYKFYLLSEQKAVLEGAVS